MKKLVKLLAVFAAMSVMVFAMSIMVSAAEATVTVPTKYFGNEKEVTKSYSFTNESKIESGESGVVIPLKVSAAGAIRLNINYTKVEKDIFVNVYTDATCTNRISIINGANAGTTRKEGYIPVNNAGTYYLKVYSYSSSNAIFTNAFSLSVGEYTYADKTIKSGQTINYFRNNGSDKFYFQYKAEQTGKVTITLPYEYGSYVTLMSSKKKALSEQEWVSSIIGQYKYTFAVKKGTIYYIMVSSNGTSAGNIQSISVKNTAVKAAKCGTKKKKAASIKAKKNIKGIIVPGSSKANWYKFQLKKNKKINIWFSGDVSGRLNIEVYTKSGRSLGSFSSNGNQIKLTPMFGKLKKGTYYIKISRNTATSSGTYSVKWK